MTATIQLIQERKYTYRPGASEMGRSYIYIRCPFCEAETKAYIWSLAGSGKKCQNCNAIHRWHRNVSQIKGKSQRMGVPLLP